ncbi:MAG TPA: glycosyltransferase [Actinotalea sp.]|nr:glycosyltransferase [Actinotalea sp.]
MSVAVLGTQPHAGHRLYEQRLASALSPLTRVAYLEPPTAPRSLGAVRRAQLWVDDGRTLVQSAWTVPFTRRLGLDTLRDVAVVRAARSAARRVGRPTALVHTEPSPVLGAFPQARAVLLVKDDYVVGAELLGWRPEDVEERLRRAVERADAVVSVSPELRERLRRFGVEATVIPPGCFPGPGRAGPDPGRPLRAALLGGVSPRVLPGHLTAVLDAGVHLDVLGAQHRTFPDASTREEVERVLADPRVTWHGPVSAERVGAILRGVDVGLVPYRDSSFNRASFPLKTIEYLAAGLPVVATPLPALDWIGSDQVHVAAGPEEFATRVREVAASASTAVSESCRGVAAQHSWERRAADWAAVLGLDPAGDPR